jgi:elongation factor P
MSNLNSSQLRSGTVFKDGKDNLLVLKYEHVTQGRGGTTIKLKVKNILTGSIIEKGYNVNDKFESVDVNKSSAQFLYSDGGVCYFMDSTSFNQFEFNIENKYLSPGEKIIVTYLEDKPIDIEIPNIVSLKVEYTESSSKGNTVNNALKTAKLETGMEIKVPMFINIGDNIKINTQNEEYVGRA